MKTRLILPSSLMAAALLAVGMLAAFAQNASPRPAGDRQGASRAAASDAARDRAAAERQDGPLRPVILAGYSDSSPAAQDPLGWQHGGPRVPGTEPLAAPYDANRGGPFVEPPPRDQQLPALVSDVLRLPPVEEVVTASVAETSTQPTPREPVLAPPRTESPQAAAPLFPQPVVATPQPAAPRSEPPLIEKPSQRVATPWGEGPRNEMPRVEMPRVEQPRVEKPHLEEGVVANPYVTDAVIVNPFFAGPLVESQPSVEQPAVENRATAPALPEQPLAEKPLPRRPLANKGTPPWGGKPSIEQPVVEQPVTRKPRAEEPVADKPLVEEPVVDKPLADKPAASPPWSAAPAGQPGPAMIAPLQTRQPSVPLEPGVEPKVEQPSPPVTSQHDPATSSDVAQRHARAAAAVVSRADEVTRGALRLAQRRAYYSARTEFIRALEVVAQALDADRNTNYHSRALVAGLRALDEADDFLPRGTATGGEIQVARVAAGHQTPVLKGEAEEVLPVQARQKYYTFAQQQLADAVGNVPAGSTALYGLGKLYGEIQAEASPLIRDPSPKMMTLQQAALMVDPQNWRAANELGVLLARMQRFEEARGWLEHSVALSRQQETWHNLQVVLAQLNERELAQHAGRQAAQLARQGRGEAAARVQWMKPEEFSRLPVDEPGGKQSVPEPQPARTAEAPAPKSGGMFQWLPWK